MMGRTLSASSASNSATVSPRATSPAEDEEEETNVVCHWVDCGRTFEDVTLLGRHVLDVHVSRVSNSDPTSGRCHWRDCPRSGKAFSTKMKLIMHLRSHTGEKPYPCTVPGCPKRFARMDILSKHLRSHANNAQRLSALQGIHGGSLVCQVCGQPCPDRASLDAHVATHPFVKPFACPAVGCGRRFANLQALYAHAEQHGSGVGAASGAISISPPSSTSPSSMQSFTPGASPASAPASFSFGFDPFNELAAAARLAAASAGDAASSVAAASHGGANGNPGASRMPQRSVTGHRPALGSWPLVASSTTSAVHRTAAEYGPYGRMSPTGVFKRRGPSSDNGSSSGANHLAAAPVGRSLSAESAQPQPPSSSSTSSPSPSSFALPPIAALTTAAAASYEEPKRLRVSRSEADLNRPLAEANAALPQEIADRAADLELLQFFAEHNRGPMLPPLSQMAAPSTASPSSSSASQQQQQQQQQQQGYYGGGFAGTANAPGMPHRPRQHSHHAAMPSAHAASSASDDGPLRMSRSETSLADLLDSAKHLAATSGASPVGGVHLPHHHAHPAHHQHHHQHGLVMSRRRSRTGGDAMDDDMDDDVAPAAGGSGHMMDDDTSSSSVPLTASSSMDAIDDKKMMSLPSILSMHPSPTASFSGALTPPWAGSTASSQATSPTSTTAPPAVARFVPPHSDLLAYKYPTATQYASRS